MKTEYNVIAGAEVKANVYCDADAELQDKHGKCTECGFDQVKKKEIDEKVKKEFNRVGQYFFDQGRKYERENG